MANTTILPQQLIDKFQQALCEKWGYIWGAWGAEWTASRQKQKVNYMISQYGSDWKTSSAAKSDNYYYAALYGEKWIGHRVADCSGLFRWALNEYGIAISHSSNRIWCNGYCSRKGELNGGKRMDGYELKPGTAVFVHPAGKNRTHIGLYVGGGTVIEASGTQAGVTTSEITHRKWVEWGELKAVDYGEDSQDKTPETDPDKKVSYPTVKQGSKGDVVVMLQDLLSKNGSDLKVDGIFGNGTRSAVMAFQRKYGLTVDGICGPKTWAKLVEVTNGKKKEEETGTLVSILIPDISEKEAAELKKKYSKAVTNVPIPDDWQN